MFSKILNILLADDDVDDRSFFDKALKELPIATNLTTVNDGEQLMAFLDKNEKQLPDILFLDLSMPRKSGFECLAAIKEIDKLKDIPVVMFSTSFPTDIKYEDSMIKMLLSMGAENYIRKLGNFESLKQAIHQAMFKIIDKPSDKIGRLNEKLN